MPRIARVIAAGYPHHVTQRGNNRSTVFFDDEDRQTYLTLLKKYSEKHCLRIWAYCLLDNHLHLLVVPEQESSLARGVGLTNQVYTQYLNRKLSQSGRVWQNRFFSCVVEKEKYLWAVARYIERNPLQAGFAAGAEDYPWSSANSHITGKHDPLLDDSWLDGNERQGYAEFVRYDDEEINNAIRKATKTGRPLGSENFIDSLELSLGQGLRPRKSGRPRKNRGSV